MRVRTGRAFGCDDLLLFEDSDFVATKALPHQREKLCWKKREEREEVPSGSYSFEALNGQCLPVPRPGRRSGALALTHTQACR